MAQESLVSISAAYRILGVSETALRQWTDEGKIRVFITPGGHRRYSRAELKRRVTSRQKVLGTRDLATELEDTVQLHRQIARAHLNATSWYNNLSQESQEHLADLGRRFLSLIIRYIAQPSKREETLRQARDVGESYGETLANLELPLTDSVEAFILHRKSIMNATTHLIEGRESFGGHVVVAIPLVAQVMDEALVSLVAAHQQCQASSRSKSRGAATD